MLYTARVYILRLNVKYGSPYRQTDADCSFGIYMDSMIHKYRVFCKIGIRNFIDTKRFSQMTHIVLTTYDFVLMTIQSVLKAFSIDWCILRFRRIIPRKLLYHS
jgi:hypothetical protein